ncbi:MAG: tetratricopeptide repeat protein [Bacteroidetes bacterium]|nr:tetratricopeptide repeat protein [Bacteroidota bacterium]
MRYICLFLTACYCSTMLHGQRAADSLLMLVKSTNDDSMKVKWLNDAAWETMYSDQDLTLSRARQALAIASRTKNPYSLSDSYNTIGVFYYITSAFDSSIIYCEKSLAIRLKLNDKRGLVSSYNNLGGAKKELGDYKAETECYFKALKYAEEIKDSAYQSAIINNIADAFLRQKQYKQSETYNLKSLAIRVARHDIKGQISCYINLGTTLYWQKEYKRSEEYFREAEKLLGINADSYLIAKFHANYAALLKDTGREREALKHIKLSIEENDRIGNRNSNLVNYINIASISEALGQHKEAQQEYMQALSIARETGSLQWQRQSYLGIATTSYALGQYKQAYENHLEYTTLKDSLQNQETEELITETEAKYKVEKKENEIQLLKQKEQIRMLEMKEQELRLGRRNVWLLISGIVIILLILTGYFYISRQRIKAEAMRRAAALEAEEKERMRIARDIHDDLGSGLSKIKFMAELVASQKDVGPETSRQIQSVTETATQLVDNMRDLIWVLNPENTTLDTLVSRIREYSTEYLSDFPLELETRIPEHLPVLNLTKEAYRNIFFIVKESLQNIVKHARATRVDLSVKADEHGLEIIITDNGIGMDLQSLTAKGNGLRNIQTRATAVGGRSDIQAKPGKGVRSVFAFPGYSICRT